MIFNSTVVEQWTTPKFNRIQISGVQSLSDQVCNLCQICIMNQIASLTKSETSQSLKIGAREYKLSVYYTNSVNYFYKISTNIYFLSKSTSI